MNLTLISAWNDSGGGLLNRLFDGHSDFTVWPYELQLGTDFVVDGFSGWFKTKYRWIQYPKSTSADQIFDAIIDDELKSVSLLADKSKHSAFRLSVNYEQFKSLFLATLERNVNFSRRQVVEAYLTNFMSCSGLNIVNSDRLIAHCPVIIMDAFNIWQDFPDLKFIHVVRHPAGNFYDFNRRHPQVLPEDYIKKWHVVNGFAYALSQLYPQQVKLIGLTDILQDRVSVLSELAEWLGSDYQDCLAQPSWQGQSIDPKNMGPFGGLPEANAIVEIQKRNLLPPHVIEQLSLGVGCKLALLAESGINI